TDPKLLRMVVQNLLSNAVKYTPDRGQITYTLRAAEAGDIKAAHLPASGNYLFMSVADNGYGIPETEQPKIFGKLFRADNVRAMDVEGTGLGLYIVREVATKLGGTVWFTSVEGKGTTFYVVLPYKAKLSDSIRTPVVQ
ncbi:MAG: sensor signal transduction histidine kinase, partial [Candidatus Saccharibacteria bacterium]|nr:sensor signal transduction histidine kinase [Candidatus Saccharibacteria bacterium]